MVERLSRGVVAVKEDGGKVFISWPMLASDPYDVAFNISRANGDIKYGSDKTIKLNKSPIIESTNFIDETLPEKI